MGLGSPAIVCVGTQTLRAQTPEALPAAPPPPQGGASVELVSQWPPGIGCQAEINAIRLSALFNPLAPHPDIFGEPRVKRSGTVGEEPVVVLDVPVKTGGTITLHVSTRTWRIVKRTQTLPVTKEGAERVTTSVYEDYRTVDGIPVACGCPLPSGVTRICIVTGALAERCP